MSYIFQDPLTVMENGEGNIEFVMDRGMTANEGRKKVTGL